MKLDAFFRTEVKDFVYNWNKNLENKLFYDTVTNGKIVTDTWGERKCHSLYHFDRRKASQYRVKILAGYL
ncbi:hypothetical protein OKW24_003239 [Peribacillus simplex]|nr:hypothetical protein [Peribacillus simplex]